MPFEYSAQNHDWDVTLHAAAELIGMGLEMDKRPKTGNMSMGFSFFTGGMLLSFAAIESFSASIAFTMRSDHRFAPFDFDQYRKARQFWEKMEMLMSVTGIKIDKSQGLFRRLGDMQRWRNLVTHASPYQIVPTEVQDTAISPKRERSPFKHLEYVRLVDSENAKNFYKTAFDYINLLRDRSGLDPRTFAAYKVLE